MFGRRKEGFSKEVIVTEYKHEVNEDIIKEEKIDLIDFLNDIEDEELEGLEIEAEEIVDERSAAELLADFIRQRSSAALLTKKVFLYEEDDNMEEVLSELEKDETLSDITTIKGKKDIYYYSNEVMSDNYAMIAMLVEDKDLSRMMAEMVRWNAKTYPCPTPIYYFQNSPYNYNKDEIEVTIDKIKKTEEYKDIGELTTSNNKRYLYSTLHMSKKYAQGLAEDAEQVQA